MPETRGESVAMPAVLFLFNKSKSVLSRWHSVGHDSSSDGVFVAGNYSVGAVVHLELISLEGARHSTVPAHLKQSIQIKRQVN